MQIWLLAGARSSAQPGDAAAELPATARAPRVSDADTCPRDVATAFRTRPATSHRLVALSSSSPSPPLPFPTSPLKSNRPRALPPSAAVPHARTHLAFRSPPLAPSNSRPQRTPRTTTATSASTESPFLLRRTPRDCRSRYSQETMGHEEAVVTQISAKAPSPAKDQPATFPYLDWSAMQTYYGAGILPPAFFNPGHVPPPFMWVPQNLPTPAFGKPYPAIYPPAGGFLHPFMPLMVNPLNAEPAKSVNSKDNSLNKKLKEADGTALSTGSGNSEKTSGDYSLEGSSDGNNQRACGTPKKRSLDDMTTSGAETRGASTPNDKPREPERIATLASVRIPDTAIKSCASTGSDFRINGTQSTEWPAKDDKEAKRERRKQSNRESARRSRLRKQAETEELARKVELLTAENTSLRNEMNKLIESSQKLRMENSALMEKLTKESASDEAQEEVPPEQTAAAPPPARVVKNFLSMMDGARSSSRHMEHGAPRLRQLLGSGPLPADAVAAN